MSGAIARTSSRLVGFAIGLSIVVAAVTSWRISTASGSLGADLRMLSAPTGELDVAPIGPFISAVGLKPGTHAARGDLKIRNQTGTPLAVRVRALPSTPDLDRLLLVELTAGRNVLFDGVLADLRSWTERSIRLASGEQTILRVRSWFPETVRTGYQGRIEDVGLELSVATLGA